ncbi:response regulator transcription factor [Tenacibaculum sp. nBUS_03]|uniref:response regulator transcription factor n=1 Tax=Tenacibaculum sp. nBUS_03 TaxID=3395320 RepID=UPI003EBDA825
MKVHVVDNHKVIYEGFKAMLEAEGITVDGWSSDGVELLKYLKNNTADVLIVDYSMPNMDGNDVLQYFLDNNIEQKVLMFSGYVDYDFIKNSMAKGARGYLLKSDILENIVKALKMVNDGFLYYSPEVKSIIIEHESKPCNDKEGVNLDEILSDTQVAILKLILGGYSNKEVSDFIGIEEATVRAHLFRMRDKLEVKTNVGLVKLAIKNDFN